MVLRFTGKVAPAPVVSSSFSPCTSGWYRAALLSSWRSVPGPASVAGSSAGNAVVPPLKDIMHTLQHSPSGALRSGQQTGVEPFAWEKEADKALLRWQIYSNSVLASSETNHSTTRGDVSFFFFFFFKAHTRNAPAGGGGGGGGQKETQKGRVMVGNTRTLPFSFIWKKGKVSALPRVHQFDVRGSGG